MADSERPRPRRTGAGFRPPNRFGGAHFEVDPAALSDDPETVAALEDPRVRYLPDRSRSVVSANDSPDVGFRFSLNPYRGCQHGCSYCYARPTHEYLGLDAGVGFETTILVKHDAPALLREFLGRPGWGAEPVVLSGVTDPYQPAEVRFGITRGCLEVAADCRQPVALITKNALILRDLPLIARLAADRLVQVNVSVTTLDAELARGMEPRTSPPAARLRAIRGLAEAGVPVRVLVAPVIPGLTDAEIPAILDAAREAGAIGAGYGLVRLPLAVGPIFWEWLDRTRPGRADRVRRRIRECRGGRANDSTFGRRMVGTGEFAARIADLFRLFRRRAGLDGPLPPLESGRFRPPADPAGQMFLF